MRVEIIKDLFLDALMEIIYFPYWWYTRGLKKALFFSFKQTKIAWNSLALGILLINFFRPMYGEKGFDAYFLSLMVRTVQLCLNVSLMILILISLVIFLITWLFLPLFLVFKIFTG